MSERTRRIGLNEAVFRAVNEEIEGLAQRFALVDQKLDLICECGNSGCAERIHLGHDEYAQLRSDSTLFATVPGHEFPDVETVVGRHDGYQVVKKDDGEAAELAERTDVSD
jgi:hypothetical protein